MSQDELMNKKRYNQLPILESDGWRTVHFHNMYSAAEMEQITQWFEKFIKLFKEAQTLHVSDQLWIKDLTGVDIK